jgi:hypothetical protein
MRYNAVTFLVWMLLSGSALAAQNHEHTDHQHHHPKNELGIANLLVYLGNEQEFSYGLHIHYLRAFDESKFGAGLGYEQIFDEHAHKTLGIIGSYRPISHFYILLSPGISLYGHEESTIRFALHLETTYEFEIKNLHLGPALGFGYSSQDYHVSLGLHLGYVF